MIDLTREIELFSNRSEIPAEDIRRNIAALGFDEHEIANLLYFAEDVDLNPFFVLVTKYYNDIYYMRENSQKFAEFGLEQELLLLYNGFVNLAENVDLDINPHLILANLDQNINDAIKYHNPRLEEIRRSMVNILKYNRYIVYGEKGIESRIAGLANMDLLLQITDATDHEKNALALYELREVFPATIPEDYDYYYLENLEYYQIHLIESIVDLIFSGYDENARDISELMEPLYSLSADEFDYSDNSEEYGVVESMKNPVKLIEGVKKEVCFDFEKIEKNIKEKIFGQEKQVEQFIKRLKVLNFGTIKEKGAKAVFLLAGPTGVGKTELAKQLSAETNLPMVRMDMSEYKESHQISKIIGSPPGYIGSDDKGNTVFSKIEEQKRAVVLIDEIEKAHPSILDVFLHIFDEGKAKNNKQKEIDFSECIFVLTTNIGSVEATKSPVGFNKTINVEHSYKGSIESKLRPEFINRIDQIIYFNSLNEKNITDIIDLTVDKMKSRLKEKGYDFNFNLEKNAYDYLLSKINYKKYGARDVFRVISDEIIPDLIEISEENKDGNIKVSYEEELKLTRVRSKGKKK